MPNNKRKKVKNQGDADGLDLHQTGKHDLDSIDYEETLTSDEYEIGYQYEKYRGQIGGKVKVKKPLH